MADHDANDKAKTKKKMDKARFRAILKDAGEIIWRSRANTSASRKARLSTLNRPRARSMWTRLNGSPAKLEDIFIRTLLRGLLPRVRR